MYLTIRILFVLFLIFSNSSVSFQLDVQSRIQNGRKSDIEEFPHAAALERLVGFKMLGLPIGIWTFTCGGSIVSPRWILTAKHCCEIHFLKFRAVIGTSYVSIVWESNEHIRNIESIKKHDGDDIALFKLESPLSFSSKVQAIKLSSFTKSDESKLKRAVLAGWGKTDSFYYRSLWLKSIEVQFAFKYPRHEIQTMGDGGACPGDSGSGLIIDVKGTKYLHGVVSAAMKDQGCRYNMHVRVSDYLSWINSIIS